MSAKMAAEEKQQVNDALETLVSVTEKSGKLRKDLKQDIHESVSKLRKLFSHLMNQLETVKHEYSKYREEVKNATNVAASGGTVIQLDKWRHLWTTYPNQGPMQGGKYRHLEEEIERNYSQKWLNNWTLTKDIG